MATMFPASTIKRHALELGFDLVGIAPPSALGDLEFLPRWVKKGFGGEMRYLADPRREDPRRVLPSVKSIICVGLIYNTPYPYSTDIADPTGGEGVSRSPGAPARDMRSRAWISRYAWGKDYHEVMRSKLEQLRTAAEKLTLDVETRVYVDTGPIMERPFARLSGLGWMGKNTCLINEQKGSWFFLGVILTNLELELELPAPDRCGSCTRCLEACPTGALIEPYVMDASRCISYFNIELKGAIPEEFRTAIGRNVFGCDICQDVCPWNSRPLSLVSGPLPHQAAHDEDFATGSAQRRAAATNLAEFQPMQVEIESRGPLAEPATEDGPVLQISTTEPFSLFNPRLEKLASITEEDFQRVFARSPIKRAKYRGWLRSLCVVMGNSGDRQFIPWLEAAADHPDPLVQEHAAWALRNLQGGV
ncbi:MAG TPA: tRNA epoxyqueuosine(34) reductase QueG [Terriglobia bacterium]|nr:tRNA epoxyqueuosine(34) reductase QueG [Terriglobia bacterium]